MQLEKTRLGWFFVLIGLVLLVVFFATSQTENTICSLLFIGAAALFLGAALVWRNRKPAVDEMRFRTLRRISEKNKERKARKKNE